jgi:hypothetical protein
MGFVRFVLWTSCCIAIGIFSATVELGDRTLWDHARIAWKNRVASSQVDIWKEELREKLEDARGAVTPTDKPPRERHSDQDRSDVKRLIAKGKP